MDLSLLKIIGPIDNVQLADGSTFPFTPSTPLYPEWNVASLPHVSDTVNREVQTNLLNLAAKKDLSGQIWENCDSWECSDNQTEASCFQDCMDSILPCGLTPEVATGASIASTQGKFEGWRTTLSYMPVRNMQHSIDFLSDDDVPGQFRCARAGEVADAVVCPPGHFKREPEDIKTSCEQIGLDCFEFQCLCSPCVRAYDVDFTWVSSERPACPKFSVCGSVEQTKSIQFKAVDNKKRSNITVVATVLDDNERHVLDRMVDPDHMAPFQYFFQYDAVEQPPGVVILEVSVDGEQISESPFRLEILDRDCQEDTGDVLKVPDDLGKCVCRAGAFTIRGGSCVRTLVVLPSIFVPLLLIAGLFVRAYVRKKRRQAEAIWRIDPSELVFDQNPVILGRGTFGMVIKADFRGTPVAVKRVLPPQPSKPTTLMTTKGRKSLRKSVCGRRKEGGPEQPALQDDLFSDDEFLAESESSSDDEHGSNRLRRSRSFGGTASFTSRSMSIRSLLSGESSIPTQDYDQMKHEFVQEMSLLSKLRHPSITTVMGAIVATGTEPMMVMVCVRHCAQSTLTDVSPGVDGSRVTVRSVEE